MAKHLAIDIKNSLSWCSNSRYNWTTFILERFYL